MKQISILLILLFPFSSFAQPAWLGINAVPKQWIMLNRDSLGYLIYEPCDGSTPRITIDSGYITIYPQLDAADKLSIVQFVIGKDKKSFYIHSANENLKFDFNVKMIDNRKNLVLWDFGEKWLMTPTAFAKEFRIIDNRCDSAKVAEKHFLPIEL